VSGDPAEHPFLTARHIDDLTDAVHTLVRTMTLASAALQRSTAALLAATEQIARNTDNLPALMEVLMRKAVNGDALVADRTGT
jgi:hypothetical protein